MTKLRHYDNLGTVRFVTFSCHQQRQYLSSNSARQILVDQIDKARNKHGFKLFAYVIMPEHVHLVIYPPEKMKLGIVIREIKSLTARNYFAGINPLPADSRRIFWKHRCYDHNCRTKETIIEKIKYCHKNPVVRGLVKNPGGWKWSSYNWYQGKRDVPLIIDEMEF